MKHERQRRLVQKIFLVDCEGVLVAVLATAKEESGAIKFVTVEGATSPKLEQFQLCLSGITINLSIKITAQSSKQIMTATEQLRNRK